MVFSSIYCIDLFVGFYNQVIYPDIHQNTATDYNELLLPWLCDMTPSQCVSDTTSTMTIQSFSLFGAILIQFKALTVSEYIAENLFTSYLYHHRFDQVSVLLP